MKFAAEVFAVSPHTTAKLIETLRREPQIHKTYFHPSPLPYLTQGDIVERLTFFQVDADGDPATYEGPGLMISSTCDAHQDETILFAACYDYDEYKGQVGNPHDLAANMIFHLFYLPPSIGGSGSGLVADLAFVTTYNRSWVQSRLDEGAATKLLSLSQRGWYFLNLKMTAHFLRQEGPGVARFDPGT